MNPPYSQADVESHVRGYPRLAAEMSLVPTTAIFRRFGALNARNLLYMQSELTEIEQELLAIEKKDSEDAEDFKYWRSKDYYWIRNYERAEDQDPTHYNLVMKMKEKLKEYNEALHLASSIHTLAKPEPFDLRDMQCFLSSDDMALPLIGEDSMTWGSWSQPNRFTKDGLIALCPRRSVDIFTKTLQEQSVHVMHFFQRRK